MAFRSVMEIVTIQIHRSIGMTQMGMVLRAMMVIVTISNADIVPIDEDGDGFSSNCDGDGDDSNPFVLFPYAMDLVGDGIDQDCDGEDATEMLSLVEIIYVELMKNRNFDV